MAKEFDEIVRQITDLRQQNEALSRNLYLEKQAMITDQYRLQQVVNQNQDGKEWNVYLCCDKLHQPEMFIFELWQKNMKMILKF